jgi:hypothetical protein
MCELPAVAAAGPAGLTADEVVARRAAFAKHLGVELYGDTLKYDTPFHIKWAIRNSNHTPPKHTNDPVNLGRARAKNEDGRFSLVWDMSSTPSRSLIPFAVSATALVIDGDSFKHGIEIAWSHGIERIEVDLQNLSLNTRVTETVHHFDDQSSVNGVKFEYNTSSTITAHPDGAFCLTITYAPEANSYIRESESLWGTSTFILRPDDLAGTVQWTDDNFPECNGLYTFHTAIWKNMDGNECQILADEAAIQQREDLAPTDKLQLIQARRGQGKFRASVLRKERHCRVTGINDPAHLRASHIKPWAGSDDFERLDSDNGLMLAPHIDHLFDRAFISFDDEGRLLVLDDPKVRILLAAWKIDVATPALPPRPFNARQRLYLAEHRKRLARPQED